VHVAQWGLLLCRHTSKTSIVTSQHERPIKLIKLVSLNFASHRVRKSSNQGQRAAHVTVTSTQATMPTVEKLIL
jgi:hypothetical protein